jgi:23S rRNA-/tRNA-specific pseudouridylate synthase
MRRLLGVASTRHEIVQLAEEPPKFETVRAALRSLDPGKSEAEWQRHLAFGGVFVNGRPVVDLDAPLATPSRLEYYAPVLPLSEMRLLYPAFHRSHVIYEDEDLIVAFKPARLPTMAPKEQRPFCLRAYLLDYLTQSRGARIGAEGGSEPELHMPSRLDCCTAGLVVSSVSQRMHAPLQRLFERHQIRKSYLLEATCAQRLDWKVLLVERPIGDDPLHSLLRRVSDDGQSASTEFRVLCSSSYCEAPLEREEGGGGAKGLEEERPETRAAERPSVVLEAFPLTGRTHQIRVHAAHLGLPILNDEFYQGERTAPDPEDAGDAFARRYPPRLRLLSYQLAFRHPFTGRELNFQVPNELLPNWARQALAPRGRDNGSACE